MARPARTALQGGEYANGTPQGCVDIHYAYGKPKETLALEKKPVVLVIRIDPPPEGAPRDNEDYAEPGRLTDALEPRAGGQDIPTVALR